MNRRQLLSYGAFGLAATRSRLVSPWGQPRSAARNQEIWRRSSASSYTPPSAWPASAIAPRSGFSARRCPGPHPMPEGGFKDGAGRIKRQAARFRLLVSIATVRWWRK